MSVNMTLTASAVFFGLMLSGCSSSQNQNSQAKWDESAFCYNGGRTHHYSCNPELAYPQPDMHHAEIDEEWMYMKLWEIKAWLKQLKKQDNPHKAPLYLVKIAPGETAVKKN